MSKKRGNRPLKKNQVQRQNYKDFISSASPSESTVPYQNAMLVGSNEIRSYNPDGELYGKEEVKSTPLKYRILDWIRNNILAGVIIAIIATLLIGFGKNTINHEIKLAVLNQRVDNIEKRIETIEKDSVDKEYFRTELNHIRVEIMSDNYLPSSDMDQRINEIESRIEDLEKDSD